ncbi:MAG: 3-dehydroquinate synthase II [Nitrososphaerales archaeon]
MGDKELIVKPLSLNKEFLEYLSFKGIKSLLLEPEQKKEVKKGFKIYCKDEEADVYLSSNYEDLNRLKEKGKFAFLLEIDSPEKISLAKKIASEGAESLFIITKDWRIIPLENLVAELRAFNTKLIAKANSVNEIPTLFGILEKGVDGVLVEIKDFDELDKALKGLRSKIKLELKIAQITEVRDLEMGERVCVDTTSILSYGEGLLVGNKANFFFLIHNESVGSSFTSPRPFRVNAGAVHSYTLMPNSKTKYLSELSSGDEVLIIDKEGYGKVVSVGRIKIERRPLKLVKAKVEEEEGSVILQNAETIRLISSDKNLLTVTELKKDDKVLVYLAEQKARHFGMAVDEFIIEK